MDSDIGKQVADNYLAQSGILGMKWGVRRSQEQLGRTGGRSLFKNKKKSSGEVAPSSTRTKRLSELTDEELNKVISRLQKEKLYKDLVSPQGKSNPIVQKGETIAHKMLSAFGTMIAGKFAAGAGQYLANKFTEPRQTKVDANAANDKARYAVRNQKLEDKRQAALQRTRTDQMFEDRKWREGKSMK